MSLAEPNIPEYDKVVLDELIEGDPTLNNPRFLQLHKSLLKGKYPQHIESFGLAITFHTLPNM
jgi:hypothetical protein